MGWSQELTGSSTITDEEVDAILDQIAARNTLPGLSSRRQKWGWSAACDIVRRTRDEGQILVFSGAWFSVNTDLPERFAEASKSRGHAVVLGERT